MKWLAFLMLALALPLTSWPWADRLVRGTDQSASADAIVVLPGGGFGLPMHPRGAG